MAVKIPIDIFFEKIEQALNAGLPFTAFQHPQEDKIKGFFQRNDKVYHAETYKESGFVFAPFNEIKSAVLFPEEESEVFISSFYEDDFDDAIKKGNFEFDSEQEKNRHIDLVAKGIDFLKTTQNKKVVLSRKITITSDNFELITTFKKLMSTYKNTMVYVWFHPKVGLWLGATPETLIKVNNNKFSTMSLAGTQVYNDNLDVIWQDKEVQEQQFVTDFIGAQIEANVKVSKPYTIKAGNILHICTDISGQITPELSLDSLIKKLHPTPAVCGLPQKTAKVFILDNENYNRTFYTGFLGELNINGRSNLFVNLRCMQVLKTSIEIYVGGGITVDSIPEKEWKETVAKSKIMLKVLV